jgi:anti-sigma factor ChrR (cupin superfamily)
MSTDDATFEVTTSLVATLEATSLSDSSKKWNPSYGSRSSMKIEIKSFDEKINFGLWQWRMHGVLLQQKVINFLVWNREEIGGHD